MHNNTADKCEHTCEECGRRYRPDSYLKNSLQYFESPWNYREGSKTYCLECWLGIGSKDVPVGNNDLAVDAESSEHRLNGSLIADLIRTDRPSDENYEALMEGDIVTGFRGVLTDQVSLIAMPIVRLHVEYVAVFPGTMIFYPPGFVDLGQLHLVPNAETNSLAERCSLASGITLETLEQHALVVFPCRLNYRAFLKGDHSAHLELIRQLSDEVDRCCLNFMRYVSCRLDPVDNLPGHAGQIINNHMMAGALIYNQNLLEARIIGGAVFTHHLTRGLGLHLAQLEWDQFPKAGEMGQITQQALSLYASLLESDNPTARFMQALSLLEFLAFPDEYKKFEEVKKVIARYIAGDRAAYQQLLDRFYELTGKKDPETGRVVGYRTRVVHMGDRIEKLVPSREGRKSLFLELDGYIRPVIDDMIKHSHLSLDDYLKLRDTLRPFEGS